MKIRHKDSTLIVLVEFEEIPFSRLLLDSSFELMNNVFNFKSIDPAFKPDNQPILLYSLGSLETEDGIGIINKIEIEHRKIAITVEGDTEFAEKVFLKLGEVFKDIHDLPGDFELHTITKTYESVIIANLDFHASNLLDLRLNNYVSNDLLTIANLQIAQAAINHFSLKFRIDYILSEEDLKKYKITVTPKVFTIGPRDGTRIDDQIYISQAPVKTGDHISILNKIEELY